MKSVKTTTEIAIIGAGIAGLSAGAELSAHSKITVLERESQPAYHATGRSAAYFSPAYGNACVQGLTLASDAFYKTPPKGFADVPLLHPRDAMHVVPAGHESSLEDAVRTTNTMHELDLSRALETVPILDRAYVAAAASELGGGDLNVGAIVQGYQRVLTNNGGEVLTNAEVLSIEKRGGLFKLTTPDRVIECEVVVCAAGAWADPVAELAGVRPIGLTPKRRSAFLIPEPDAISTASSASLQPCKNWPLVINQVDPLYFKPDAGALLISPMDETPSPACDAAPEDLDVAYAIERFHNCTTLEVKRVTHRWAGLRTFAPDETFVVGFDPDLEGFFWLAGQGGYGVQAAPALSRLSAALIDVALGRRTKESVSKTVEWEFAEQVAPARFRSN